MEHHLHFPEADKWNQDSQESGMSRDRVRKANKQQVVESAEGCEGQQELLQEKCQLTT